MDSVAHTDSKSTHIHLFGGPLDGECLDLNAECGCGCGEPLGVGHVIVLAEDDTAYRVEAILLASAVYIGHGSLEEELDDNERVQP